MAMRCMRAPLIRGELPTYVYRIPEERRPLSGRSPYFRPSLGGDAELLSIKFTSKEALILTRVKGKTLITRINSEFTTILLGFYNETTTS